MRRAESRARREGAAELLPLLERRAARSRTVVVIDADPQARARVATWLSSRGFRVRATADVGQGLDCVRHDAAGVVVLGYAEGSPALDLIRRLRGRFEPLPLRSPPRIVVLGDGLDEPRARFARRLGADVVLRGGGEVELAEAVRRLAHECPEPSGGRNP